MRRGMNTLVLQVQKDLVRDSSSGILIVAGTYTDLWCRVACGYESAPCLRAGPAVNESERKAFEQLKARLTAEPGGDEWILLTNLTFSATHRRQSDEIDIVAIGPPGSRSSRSNTGPRHGSIEIPNVSSRKPSA